MKAFNYCSPLKENDYKIVELFAYQWMNKLNVIVLMNNKMIVKQVIMRGMHKHL